MASTRTQNDYAPSALEVVPKTDFSGSKDVSVYVYVCVCIIHVS